MFVGYGRLGEWGATLRAECRPSSVLKFNHGPDNNLHHCSISKSKSKQNKTKHINSPGLMLVVPNFVLPLGPPEVGYRLCLIHQHPGRKFSQYLQK